MTRTATMIGGLLVATVASLVPPPQQMLKSPKVLYGAAIIKAAVGDADSALRLLQRASEPVAPAPAPHSVKSVASCPYSSRA